MKLAVDYNVFCQSFLRRCPTAHCKPNEAHRCCCWSCLPIVLSYLPSLALATGRSLEGERFGVFELMQVPIIGSSDYPR